jgi:hypothetical protein
MFGKTNIGERKMYTEEHECRYCKNRTVTAGLTYCKEQLDIVGYTEEDMYRIPYHIEMKNRNCIFYNIGNSLKRTSRNAAHTKTQQCNGNFSCQISVLRGARGHRRI